VGKRAGSTWDCPIAFANTGTVGSQLWMAIVARWYSSEPGAQLITPVASTQLRSHWQPQRDGSFTRSVVAAGCVWQGQGQWVGRLGHVC
jgi:hypothetical protein